MIPMFMLLIIWLPVFLSLQSQPKGWRGIEPLNSSREDVERLLGHCSEGKRDYCVYKTDLETILVVYSDGPCEKGWPFGYNVPTNTVIRLEVSPVRYLTISALGLKLDEYETKVNKDGSLMYVNHRQGVAVRVFEEKVGSVIYGSTSEHNHLRCEGSAQTDIGKAVIADPHDRLLAYGDVNLTEEMQILARFAELLRSRPNAQGYIIVYAGERSLKNEGARRLQCQTDYLTKQQLIDKQRFTTVDGGYRDKGEVELYIVAKDSPTLLPFPTVRPSRVTIIPENTASTNVLSLCSPGSKN